MHQEYFITNEQELKEKISLIKKAGARNLRVITDFDRTLTQDSVNGVRSHTSYELIQESGLLPLEYTERTRKLYQTYYPIETSSEISQELKNKKMIEWWSGVLNEMVNCNMSKAVIDAIVQKGGVHFREGVFGLLDLLAEHGIPLSIHSAGLGDVIQSYLKHNDKLYLNIHITSNFLIFDGNGNVKGYKSEIIHPLNKNEAFIKQTSYLPNLAGRRNIILLGDVPEDAKMLDDLDYGCAIKIGFLNRNARELFGIYKSVFDVIIPGDGTMHYVNSLLNTILD